MLVDTPGLGPAVAHESRRRAMLLLAMAIVTLALVARVFCCVVGTGCDCVAGSDAELEDVSVDLTRVELTL